MRQKHLLIKGTLILTATGIITRLIGFVFRIFLSQNFGEESVGIYQLVFPIYALGFSLTCAGIEIAISRTVAKYISSPSSISSRYILFVGCVLSILLSVIFMLIIQTKASYIAITILKEPRCSQLLRILMYGLPFASIHSCIYGFYIGMKQTRIPAISQLIEQIIRVASVYIIFMLSSASGKDGNIIIAVYGIVFGEIFSSLFCLYKLKNTAKPDKVRSVPLFKISKEILSLSLPLTGNRLLFNVLQTVESISIPLRLQMFGYSIADSLSIYGVLTGMALPCILFPSAITNSLAAMMLPTVTELQTTKNHSTLSLLIKKVVSLCSILGLITCAGFVCIGSYVGEHIFHSTLAGDFIITLGWICPFLYTNTTLLSIINGFGKTIFSLLFNSLGLSIRIVSVFLLIPCLGIQGYLIGLLISQIILFLCTTVYLYYFLSNNKKKIA